MLLSIVLLCRLLSLSRRPLRLFVSVSYLADPLGVGIMQSPVEYFSSRSASTGTRCLSCRWRKRWRQGMLVLRADRDACFWQSRIGPVGGRIGRFALLIELYHSSIRRVTIKGGLAHSSVCIFNIHSLHCRYKEQAVFFCPQLVRSPYTTVVARRLHTCHTRSKAQVQVVACRKDSYDCFTIRIRETAVCRSHREKLPNNRYPQPGPETQELLLQLDSRPTSDAPAYVSWCVSTLLCGTAYSKQSVHLFLSRQRRIHTVCTCVQ